MAEPSVLLVDEDPRRRRALEVGLRRSGFRVTVAGSAEQALWFLDHALPEAIVSASRFSQGMSSVSLAELIRKREEWSSIVLIMIRDPDGSPEALALADDVVDEGVTIAALAVRTRHALFQRRVDRLGAADEAGLRRLQGSFEDRTPIDLLRLIEGLGASGTLGVETLLGPATLWFSDGRVIDGAFGRFEGEEAVFRLLMVEEGSFELSLATCLHAEVISAPMENLIGDSLRQLDEWMRLCGEVPPLDSCLEVDPASLESRRDELAEELFALIRSCDGRRTIREVVDGSELGPLLALEAIQNLRRVGVLVERSTEEEPEVKRVGDAWAELRPKELPPLPAFPEPFPGLGAEIGIEHDMPLVSGIPEEISEEERRPPTETKPSGATSGKLRSLAGKAVAAVEYVFRPPTQGGESGAGPRSPSSSAIERAIDDAISGQPRGEGARSGPAMPVRGAANGGPSGTGPAPKAPAEDEASSAPEEALPATKAKGRGELEEASERASRGDGASAKRPEVTRNRLGRVVSLVRIREPLAEPAPRPKLDREAFTAVAGTAAGELVVAQAEPSIVECEEALALALRTPSIVLNLADIEVVEDEGAESAEVAEPEGVEPEAAEPEVAEPEVAEPEGVEPEAVEPEGVEPEGVEPEGAEPEGVEPEATEPEGAEPEATEPEVVPAALEGALVDAATTPELAEVGLESLAGESLEDGREDRTAGADDEDWSGGSDDGESEETGLWRSDAAGGAGEAELRAAGAIEAGDQATETAPDEARVAGGAAETSTDAGVEVEEDDEDDEPKSEIEEKSGESARAGASGASISSAKRSLPATPVGVVTGEIVDPGAAASRAALALVPESRGDLERLGALANEPPPSTSAAMWSARPPGRSSVVLSAGVSSSGATQSGAAYSGVAHSGAAHSGAGLSMAARSMAARSMSGASAAHLFGANASAISRLEPTLGAYEDDEPVELSRSSRGWLWVFLIGAAALGGWVWMSYAGADGEPAEGPGGEEAPAEQRVIRPLSQTDVVDGAPTGDGGEASAGETAEGPGLGGEEALSAEESAALAKQLEEGEKLYRQGSEKEASMVVAQILARAPKDPAALLLRAKISLDRGELSQALDSAKRAADHRPDFAEAYLTIGVVLEEKAEIADAIAAYERYLELAPDARYASGIRRQVASLRRKLP